jgi:hypothetical protein
MSIHYNVKLLKWRGKHCGVRKRGCKRIREVLTGKDSLAVLCILNGMVVLLIVRLN